MIYFFDRNFGHALPMALSLLGLEVELHDAHFDNFTQDDMWLADIGARGWRMFTQDPKFLRRESEMQALIANRVGCFVLVTDQMNRWAKLRVIAKAWDEIERIVESENPPYIYRITKSGDVKPLYPPPSS